MNSEINARTLILGTHNAKKAKELIKLLTPYGVDVKTLAELSGSIKVEETGTTFAENAALKASQQAKHFSAWVLGEDSGLCVDALNGDPGVYTARFAGEHATDSENNAKLLSVLRDVPETNRGAHYVCSMALSNPSGKVVATAEEQCSGRIRRELSGTGGFGYDPMFEVVEYHQTFAELGDAVKSVLSHRARATRRILPQIIAWMNPLGKK
jgi:XTP/dITP diphosphohydrolase